MGLKVLFGQRKCSYPGEFALEALACMDGNSDDMNPDYLLEQYADYLASDEFDRLAVITLDVNQQALYDILYPENKAVPAAVIVRDEEVDS